MNHGAGDHEFQRAGVTRGASPLDGCHDRCRQVGGSGSFPCLCLGEWVALACERCFVPRPPACLFEQTTALFVFEFFLFARGWLINELVITSLMWECNRSTAREFVYFQDLFVESTFCYNHELCMRKFLQLIMYCSVLHHSLSLVGELSSAPCLRGCSGAICNK